MIYGSVCSGIEAATAAWHPLGLEPAWFSEIEKFPCAVLNHHYPHIENRGDMTKFKEWKNGTIDLLVGGTPCQSFSVAGLRKGSHPKSALFYSMPKWYGPFLTAGRRRRGVSPSHSLNTESNGPGSWEANPWVWVVEFKRIEQ